MAAKQKVWDVLVVHHYDQAVGHKKSGGRRVMPGGVLVVSACAGPDFVLGLEVGAIHVDDTCWTTGVLHQGWADEVIEALLAGATKA